MDRKVVSICRDCNAPIYLYSLAKDREHQRPCFGESDEYCSNLENPPEPFCKNVSWLCESCYYSTAESVHHENNDCKCKSKSPNQIETRYTNLLDLDKTCLDLVQRATVAEANISATQYKAHTSMLNRRVVIPIAAIALSIILIGLLFFTEGRSGFFKENKKSMQADDNVGGGKILRIVPRDAWLAQPPSSDPLPLATPVKKVIVLPTRTDDCETQTTCVHRVRMTQTLNIESQNHDDIIYNFLIGGDGNVYEGRGWDAIGAHLRGFNSDSISFAYIGTFKKQKPSEKQMDVTKLLLAEGVRLGKLSQDYKIYGAYMLDPTSTDVQSDELYNSFKGWPHWSEYVSN
ncbi:peptidoglycan-recognition protein LC-like [Bactrocera dorsalis]|uniref:Peptidoglycan-recognition protein LC-like n=1 Tax=Bactrocera dorsalis TaxID=27457 RepID=A0ABM3K896_BACDO|nr:peptidoglycan-recognition protein LC-like [Bactrocera dorsalis]